MTERVVHLLDGLLDERSECTGDELERRAQMGRGEEGRVGNGNGRSTTPASVSWPRSGLGAALFGVLPPAVRRHAALRGAAHIRPFTYEEVLRPQDGPGLTSCSRTATSSTEGETGRYRLTAVMQEARLRRLVGADGAYTG